MSQNRMSRVGVVIAAVLAAIGLVAVGFIVFMAIALQSFGSNK